MRRIRYPHVPPYHYPITIYEEIKDTDFREKLHLAVRELFVRFDEHEAKEDIFELKYFAFLVHVAGSIKCSGISDLLRLRIAKGYFLSDKISQIALPVPAHDLQHMLIITLLAFGPTTSNILALENCFKLHQGRYAAHCYRGMWESNPELGVSKLPELTWLYLNSGQRSFSFHQIFKNYLNVGGSIFLKKHNIYLKECNDDQLSLIFQTLDKEGYVFKPEDEHMEKGCILPPPGRMDLIFSTSESPVVEYIPKRYFEKYLLREWTIQYVFQKKSLIETCAMDATDGFPTRKISFEILPTPSTHNVEPELFSPQNY